MFIPQLSPIPSPTLTHSPTTSDPFKDYIMIHCTQSRTLFQHSKTRTKFFHTQLTSIPSTLPQFFYHLTQRSNLSHQSLTKLYYHQWPSNTISLLSQFYTTHLDEEIERRVKCRGSKRMGRNAGFTEEQLINTFSPLIGGLEMMHEKGIVHGYVKGRSVIVNQNFETKLCDAIAIYKDNLAYSSIIKYAYFPPEFQYEQNLTVEGDLWGLGMVILEATILDNFERFYQREMGRVAVNEIQRKVEGIPESFSDEFVVAVKLLLSSEKGMRKEGVKAFVEGVIPEGIVYEKMRPQRKKVNQRCYDSQSPKKASAFLEPKDLLLSVTTTQLHSSRLPYKQQVLNQSNTPTQIALPQDKKSKIDFIKQKYRSRNSEEMQVKKKQIEKINKIIERSNAFVNELMAKRTDKVNVKIPSLNKTSINIGMSGYKREFFNENSKKGERTPVREKEEREREREREKQQTLVTNATLLGGMVVDVEVKSVSCKESPKKLYLKRQTEKLKSLSKKKG